MGGEQSHAGTQKEEEEEEEEEEEAAPAKSGEPESGAEDGATELPQCQMGNRKVDNMCFMISCTNWY